MQGWIKLHRGLMKSETFSKLTAIQQLITIYIILNANHEDGTWYDKYKDIEVPVKRGQVIVSRNKIANEWFKGDKEVTEQKVRTTLKKLERLSFLTITSTNNYTLLEVLNYNIYQAKENETNQVDNQEETKGQPRDNQGITTNKNDKNDKNDKNEKEEKKYKYAEYVSLTENEFQKLVDQFGEKGTQDRIENLSNYKGSKGKKYKSDYHTILTWERKNQKHGSTSGSDEAKRLIEEYNINF